MPLQKHQLLRVKRISAVLTENRYPNAKTLVEEFKRMDLEETLNIACVQKTILRDMKLLKEEFNCPLAFDRSRNGYYLEHHGWDFIAPVLLDDNEMLAAVIGARIAEAIFPSPLKNQVRAAVDYLLQNNNPDFLDTANIASMNILSGLYARLDPEIFMTVFSAWQQHRCIRISYADYAGNNTRRIIEPHTLVFYRNSWYTKAFCHRRNEARTFALRRVKHARLLPGDEFEPRAEIINSISPDEFLSFDKIRNVKLAADDYARDRLRSSPLQTRQTINADDTVEIPAVAKEVLFPFILSQEGNVKLLEPAELKTELKSKLQKMLDQY